MRLARRVLSVLVLAGTPVAVADDLPEIQQRGVLRVIVGTDGMPEAATLEPGAAPGLERELVEGFAALHRLPIEFVPVPVHSDRFPALLAGKGDLVVGNVGITEERRNVVAFTREVFPNRSIAVSWRPHPPVRSLEQFRRERVGTMRNSAWSARLSSAGVPAANVDDSFKTAEEVVAALRAGKVTAVAMPVDRALVEKRRNDDLQLGVFLPPSPGRAWALRKESPALLRLLDEYIANVRRGPTWNRLVIKYYGDVALELLKASATP
jgi:ABC-type amino acid transport substrate-binding protein